MRTYSDPATTASTMKRNSLYVLAIGSVGVLLGYLVIDSQALAWAGLSTVAIGAVALVVSAALSRRGRVTGGQ